MMPNPRVISAGASFGALLLLAHCGGGSSGMPGSSTGGSATGGTTSSGGTGGSGATSTGGATSSGSGGGAGGATSSGSGGASSGGAGGAISSGSGGASGGAGGTTSTGVTMDQGGVPLARPGDSTSVSRRYLNLGEMRLINNRWGSDALGCNATVQRVFINTDSTLGWDFTRPACGGARADPDFPEVEFGVAPFGTTSPLLTTPTFSSTTLLPIQIKDLTSASVTVDNFAATFQSPTYWDSNFEFWISRQNPTTTANAGVYAEIIAFLGWQSNRLSLAGGWPCDTTGTVTAGNSTYVLCHQSDTWSNGQWRFFNFNVNNGPLSTFNGKADIKAMLDWVMRTYSGFTTDMWLTRIELGTEIDDSTTGSVKIRNLTFEINGATRSVQLAQ